MSVDVWEIPYTKKDPKFPIVVELALLKFTCITVLKGHIEQSCKLTVLSRSSGSWVNWSIKIQPNLTQFNYLNVSWWWKSKLTGWGRPGELTIDAVSAVSESVLQLVAFLSDILLRELLTWSICKIERKYNIANKTFWFV